MVNPDLLTPGPASMFLIEQISWVQGDSSTGKESFNSAHRKAILTTCYQKAINHSGDPLPGGSGCKNACRQHPLLHKAHIKGQSVCK